MAKKMPGVYNVLDLSTAHIPSAKPDWGNLRVISHDFGWTVFAADIRFDHEPDWAKPLLAYARQNQCILINLDRDAEQIPELPTWSW